MTSRRCEEGDESEEIEEVNMVAEIEQLGKKLELLEVRQKQLEEKIGSQEAKQITWTTKESLSGTRSDCTASFATTEPRSCPCDRCSSGINLVP
jgi:hypothetical protein